MPQYETFSADPNDYAPDDDDTFSAEPKQKRRDSSSKFLLGCLVGCGVMMLLMTVAMVGLGFMIGSWAQEAVVQSPEEIRATTESIATLDLPESFQPDGGFRVNLPVVGELGNFVFYSDDRHDGGLILADVSDRLIEGRPAEDWARDIQIKINNQPLDNPRRLEDVTEEKITRTIRGGEVTFTITTGKRPKSGVLRIVASGSFPGRLGQSFFLMTSDAEHLSAEDVRKVIESIE